MRKLTLPVALFALLLVVTLIVTSCSIEEADPIVYPDAGNLEISALDSISGKPITNAQVFIDGAFRARTLPATVERVPGGIHQIDVRPYNGYPSRSQTISILTKNTTPVVFKYATSDTLPSENATVSFSSSQLATIAVDEISIGATTDGSVYVKPGVHSFTVYASGFRTLAPYFFVDTLEASQNKSFTFTLEALAEGNQVDDLVPDFILPDETGAEFSIGALRGQVVLVNFWFYNCQPCRIEFPEIEEIWLERAADGFRILSINVGWYNDTPEQFTEIREELGLTFPLLQNTIGLDFTTDTFGLSQAPTNFLVDQSGVIRARFGATTYEELSSMVDDLLP